MKDIGSLKIDRALDFICQRLECSRSDLLGKRRFRSISVKRQKAYLYFREAGFSYPQIGKIFNRDHSTIYHGITSLELRISQFGTPLDIINRSTFRSFFEKETE